MTQPKIAGIHHLKFNVADLAATLDFYERAFGAERIAAFDHVRPTGELFAYILKLENLGTYLELRLSPERAVCEKNLDPVTLSVESRSDLDDWQAHFDAVKVPHSTILTGVVGWLMAVEDPDGRHIRLYANETHGPGLTISSDPYWLQG